MTRRTCVILQPSYLPWRGVFDQIRRADVFVHYDDVQYDKNGWRNRNRIKGANGPFWITVPVSLPGGKLHTRLDQAEIVSRQKWRQKHWAAIAGAYRRAPHFADLERLIKPHLDREQERLVELTIPLMEGTARALGIEDTEFLRSSTLGVDGERSARLVEICRRTGADHYLSGPSARSYLDVELFTQAGITVEWMDYDYAEYPQLHGAFVGEISIVDTIAMCGTDALATLTA